MSPDRFAVGDVVRIREWDDMESEFGLRFGVDIKCTHTFVVGMRPSCGELCAIRAKNGKDVNLTFKDPEIGAKMRGYNFSTDMIEPVENVDMSPEAVRSVSDFLAEV